LYPATRSLCPWTSSTSPSLPYTFRTTSISSRVDPPSPCLGWIRCCTLLPPLCALGHQVLRRRRPTHSAQLPSQSVSVGSVVVPLYPLSVPVDSKYFIVIAYPFCTVFISSRVDPSSLCFASSTLCSQPSARPLLCRPSSHSLTDPQALRSPTLKPFAHRPSSPSLTDPQALRSPTLKPFAYPQALRQPTLKLLARRLSSPLLASVFRHGAPPLPPTPTVGT